MLFFIQGNRVPNCDLPPTQLQFSSGCLSYNCSFLPFFHFFPILPSTLFPLSPLPPEPSFFHLSNSLFTSLSSLPYLTSHFSLHLSSTIPSLSFSFPLFSHRFFPPFFPFCFFSFFSFFLLFLVPLFSITSFFGSLRFFFILFSLSFFYFFLFFSVFSFFSFFFLFFLFLFSFLLSLFAPLLFGCTCQYRLTSAAAVQQCSR